MSGIFKTGKYMVNADFDKGASAFVNECKHCLNNVFVDEHE